MQETLGHLLRQVFTQITTEAMSSGAQSREFVVLNALADQDARSQQDLAHRLGINRTIIVKLLDRLQAAGYVTRTRNPAHRRTYVLSLTGEGRTALRFGRQKINLQDRATETPTKARAPTVGSGDFCLIAALPLGEVIAHLRSVGIELEAGPVPRRGALGALDSIYFRDPNGQLLDMACFKFAPTEGYTVADVLSTAHRMRVERGDYNISDEHLADAIAELTERKAPVIKELQSA